MGAPRGDSATTGDAARPCGIFWLEVATFDNRRFEKNLAMGFCLSCAKRLHNLKETILKAELRRTDREVILLLILLIVL